MKLRTAFLWTLIVSLSLAALLGIVAILLPDLIGSDEEILITAFLLGLHSLPPLACSILIAKHKNPKVIWLGIAGSFLAWVCWLPLIWGSPYRWNGGMDWEDFLFKAGFSLTILSLWSTHFGLITLLRLDRVWPRRVRSATLISTGSVAAIGVFCLLTEFDDDWFMRFTAVLCILAGSGTLLTPVFALLETFHRKSGRESIDSDLRIQVTCPRCGSSETLPAGAANCSACGLRIEINVEEPRCSCGYLLFKLEGDRCPECGRLARCVCGCLIDRANEHCPKCGADPQAVG